MKRKNINSLKAIFKVLKNENYKEIQYFPVKFSYLAIVKEFENIINIFLRSKHLLFYFSLFPNFYLFFLNKRTRTLRKIFLFNKLFNINELNEFFEDKYVKDLIKTGLIKKVKGKYQSSFSFVPYKNFIFVRDAHHFYQSWFDPKKSKNKIWMGADSVIFLKFLNQYLKKNYFKKVKKVLEIGSGSGIVINSISDKFHKCEAIDLNSRAVEFTFINSELNNIKNLKVYKSNLYKKVKGKFNLIVANPWFVDLKKGGLEEAPAIIKGINRYLTDDGVCLMIMNSYIKNNLDTLEDYLYGVLKNKNYDINMYTNGFTYEFNRSKDYKKYNIDYVVSYNIEIRVRGSGTLKKFSAPIVRRIRDFIFLKMIKFFLKKN